MLHRETIISLVGLDVASALDLALLPDSNPAQMVEVLNRALARLLLMPESTTLQIGLHERAEHDHRKLLADELTELDATLAHVRAFLRVERSHLNRHLAAVTTVTKEI